MWKWALALVVAIIGLWWAWGTLSMQAIDAGYEQQYGVHPSRGR